MNERPIIFSADMVRAILAGRKTQTRRIIKEFRDVGGDVANHVVSDGGTGYIAWWSKDTTENLQAFTHENYKPGDGLQCPLGKVGDRLWVKEAHWLHMKHDGEIIVRYCATEKNPPRVRPPLQMKRTFSRITLKITDIRVQRVHKITDADVRAEGIDEALIQANLKFFHKNDAAPLAYGQMFDKVNGKGSWRSNPWVWALTFEVVK